MSLLTIQKYPRKILKLKAHSITKNELVSREFQQFAQDLMETLEDKFPLGAGLAAPQVGVLKRIFVLNLELEEEHFLKQTFINPEIISSSNEADIDWEGCLSFPNQWGRVKRPISVKIRALNLAGERFEINASHFYGRLLQHELDHLDGILFVDKLEGELINTQKLNETLRKEEKIRRDIGIG